MPLKMLLKVSGSFYGTHFWPNGPSPFCHKHNHYFGFRVLFEVEENRQIEFVSVSKQISSHMSKYLETYSSSSCEALASELHSWLMHGWGFMIELPPVAEVEVNEDGYSGAIVRSEGD